MAPSRSCCRDRSDDAGSCSRVRRLHGWSLLAGTNGLIAVAKRNNLVLLTPSLPTRRAVTATGAAGTWATPSATRSGRRSWSPRAAPLPAGDRSRGVRRLLVRCAAHHGVLGSEWCRSADDDGRRPGRHLLRRLAEEFLRGRGAVLLAAGELHGRGAGPGAGARRSSVLEPYPSAHPGRSPLRRPTEAARWPPPGPSPRSGEPPCRALGSGRRIRLPGRTFQCVVHGGAPSVLAASPPPSAAQQDSQGGPSTKRHITPRRLVDPLYPGTANMLWDRPWCPCVRSHAGSRPAGL